MTTQERLVFRIKTHGGRQILAINILSNKRTLQIIFKLPWSAQELSQRNICKRNRCTLKLEMRIFWSFLAVMLILTKGQQSSFEPKILAGEDWPEFEESEPSEEIAENSKDVDLFEHSKFEGKKLTLAGGFGGCINFYRSNLSNFNDYISSIKPNGNCLDVYSGVGCSGHHRVLNGRSDQLNDLGSLGWNDRISSLKLCTTNLSQVYDQPWGSLGGLCLDTCESHGKSYFSCHVSNHSLDFSFPRPAMDYFGNDCHLNCSTAIVNKEKYSPVPVLFEHEEYSGQFLELNTAEDKNRCFNFRYHNESVTNFDNWASSVDVKQHCLHLYEHIGCTGRRLELSPRLGLGCQQALPNCSWNDVTTSVSLCDATFPPNYTDPIGSRGFRCISSCETRAKPYFWCDVESGGWDFCSPRPGIDFLGNECGHNCSGTDLSENMPQLAVMYEEKWHRGNNYTISSDDQKLCFNFRSNKDSSPSKTIVSIKLKGSCVEFYEKRGCTGVSSQLITSESNATCLHEDLGNCGKKVTAASVKFCSVQSSKVNMTGSRGGTCDSSCDTRGRDFYWCYVEGTSVWEYCQPWPGVDSFGEDCGANCPHYGFNTIRQKAILYMEKGFQGKRKVIEGGNKPECFNLGYEDHLSVNFYRMVNSIDLNSSDPITCLLIYDSVGCTGNFLTFSNWDNINCHKDLAACNWGNNVASVSFCNVRLPTKIPHPKGLNGNNCVDACETRGKTFFWCNLQNGSWEFCSPRTGQNYMGDFCHGNCSNAVVVSHQKASLYLNRLFKDKHMTISSEGGRQCYNLGYDAKSMVNFNNEVSSIAMDQHTCLRLYDSIGCLGKFLQLAASSGNATCHSDLSGCGWDQKISSLSFCDTNVSLVYDEPKGIHGSNCTSPCVVQGSNHSYFWCKLANSGWDFCSPRPGVNFYGEEWLPPNTSNYNNGIIERPILYEQNKFKGNQVTVSSGGNMRCFNLAQKNSTVSLNKKVGSIDLKGSCLQLYESIGCSGDFLVVYPEDANKCQIDLAGCARSDRVTSISFCKTYLPNKYDRPKGLEGEECVDDCESRGKSYFSCHLKNGKRDFCLPRPGQDVLGNDCDHNCVDSVKTLGLDARGGARMLELNKCLFTVVILWVTLMSSG